MLDDNALAEAYVGPDTRVVDLDGKFVVPGFIDGHTHMDAQVSWDPLGTCSCWHGVTSVLMGNCGFTLAPCREQDKELVLRNLERAEDISPAAMAAGSKIVQTLRREYERMIEAQGKAAGAFSWGVKGTHPFIMMSYNNDLLSLSTLAHELGHAQQHEQNSILMSMRNVLVPAVTLSPRIAYLLIFIGLLFLDMLFILFLEVLKCR